VARRLHYGRGRGAHRGGPNPNPNLNPNPSTITLTLTLTQARIAAGLREPTSRLRSLALGGTTRGGVAIRNPRLTARAAEALAETLSRPDGSLEMLRLSGNTGIGGGGCVHLLSSLQARYGRDIGEIWASCR